MTVHDKNISTSDMSKVASLAWRQLDGSKREVYTVFKFSIIVSCNENILFTQLIPAIKSHLDIRILQTAVLLLDYFFFTGVEQEGSNSKGVQKQSEPMPDMQKGVREVEDVQRFHAKNCKEVDCEHCGKNFKSMLLYKKHAKSHTPEAAQICMECNETFCSKQALLRHAVIHSGSKETHMCLTCKHWFVGIRMRHH